MRFARRSRRRVWKPRWRGLILALGCVAVVAGVCCASVTASLAERLVDPDIRLTTERYINPLGQNRVRITIHNDNSTGAFGVSQIHIRPPLDFAGPAVRLNPRETLEYYPYIYHGQLFDTTIVMTGRPQASEVWRFLGLASNEDQPLEVEMLYAPFDSLGHSLGDRRVERAAKLPVRPPLALVLLGTLLGAALFGLLASYWNRTWSGLGSMFRAVTESTLVGLIIVLLSKASVGLSLPVAVDVRDFPGGVVVGLVAWRFRGVVGEFLGLVKPKSAPTTPAAGEPPPA